MLSAQKKAAYCDRYVGQVLPVLIEQKKDYGWLGHTDNFIPVCLPPDSAVTRNALVTVQLVRYDPETGVMQATIDNRQPAGLVSQT
jgi:tRNA A37 methylthiotransferase MiaB